MKIATLKYYWSKNKDTEGKRLLFDNDLAPVAQKLVSVNQWLNF